MKRLLCIFFATTLVVGILAAQPLSGNYTVGGTSPNYATLQAAANAVKVRGVSGPVWFNIRPGIYMENGGLNSVVILDSIIAGISSTNRITFQPDEAAGGNVENVRLQINQTAQTSTSLVGIRVDYVTIRNLTLEDVDTAEAGANFLISIDLGQGPNPTSVDIVIEGCQFLGNSYAGGGATYGTDYGVFGSTNVANIVIRQNMFQRLMRSVEIGGTAGSNGSVVVEDNQFLNAHNHGDALGTCIKISASSTIVRRNYLDNAGGVGSLNGIDVQADSGVIERNTIKNGGGASGQVPTFRAIIVDKRLYSTNTRSMLVANNMISGSASVGGWGSPIMGRVGIIAQAKAQIIHNTIVHPYREQISTGISLSNGADSSTVLNNIVVEYGIPLGILVRSIVLFDQAVVMPGLISDYNVFFYNQTGVYLAAVGSNRYTSLSAYQAASSLDANSISKEVEFSGDDRYPHLSDCQGQDPQLNGVPYPGIVNDIDGDPRSLTAPTRGADEGRRRATRMFGDVFRARVRSGMAQLYYHTVATGRFDNLMVDGLAVTDFAGRQIQLYHTLPQTRSFVLSGTLPLDFGPLSVRFFDLDHDGYLDVIAGGDTNVVKVFWGDGVGGFSQSTTVPTRGWVRSIDTARVSFYNMRTVALMEASGLTPDMSFLCYLNNTSGRNLAHHTVVKSLPGGGSVPDTLHDLLTDFAVGDLDGNGSHEVASPGTQQRFYVFRDTAFGNVPWGHHDIHTYSTQAFGSSASIAMARFSGGLLNDIITPGWSVPQHHTCILLRNQGGMNFSPDTIISGTYPYALVSMDYDNDGDLDCIAANWDLKRQGVSVFLNDGAGHFTEELNCHQGFGSDIPLSIVASDYDLDGRDDLAIATADSLFVLYNLGNVTAIDEDPKSGIPAEFSLEQNYPNPFNPATHISFSVPDFGFVSLKVYDILGREVEMLVNELKAPGRHSVTWDASRVASGVYYYALQSGASGNVKKMVLIK